MHLRGHRIRRCAIAFFAVSAALAGAATAAAGVTERVSVSSSSSQANDRSVGRPAISADGNLVAFDSTATNLVPGVTNGQDNVYVRDRAGGATELVSVTSSGNEPNGASSEPDLSGDGRFVAFETAATNLVPGGPNAEIVVFDRLTHTTTPVSVAGKKAADGQNPSISDDGRYVAFQSNSPDLAPGHKASGNPPYIYVRDLVNQKTELVSVNSAGKPVGDFSRNPVISGDGRYVAFQSSFVAGTTNGTSDVFVHDLQTGSTVLVSVNSAGVPADRGDASDPGISSDGRYIVFDAAAQNLVPDDTNQAQDVFVHDMLTGQTTRISVDSVGNQANDSSDQVSVGPQISGDGRHVTFESAATNLVRNDTNTCPNAFQPLFNFAASGQCPDVFVHDLQTGATTRASVDSNGNQADGPSTDPAVNADGSVVAFLSFATNLVPNDTNTCGTYTNPGQCPDDFVHAG
jgi:Tol biopolymer transport system component